MFVHLQFHMSLMPHHEPAGVESDAQLCLVNVCSEFIGIPLFFAKNVILNNFCVKKSLCESLSNFSERNREVPDR